MNSLAGKEASPSSPSTRRYFLLATFGVIALSCSSLLGCQCLSCETSSSPPAPPLVQNHTDDAILHSGQIRRIVILPFENRTNQQQATATLQNQIARQIQGCGLFEVVDVSLWYDDPCPANMVTSGEFPYELLVDLYQRFHADAVMFGSINEHSAYWPLSLGVTIHLVDTREGRVLSTVDGNWSVADDQTYQDYDQFLQSLRDNPAAQDPRLLHSSPTFFSDYVARLIVSTWKPAPAAP